MGENGFQVVGFGIGGQGERSSEGGVRIAGIKIDIGIENLSRSDGDFAAADLFADAVGGNHAGEGQHTRSERHVGLIKTQRPTVISLVTVTCAWPVLAGCAALDAMMVTFAGASKSAGAV